jgi:hypothetical protein
MLLEREDVPGGNQDLARDGGLGGVGLAVAALDVGVRSRIRCERWSSRPLKVLQVGDF